MKGIIFNELEKMVTEAMGLEAWDSILGNAVLQTKAGYFVGPQTYPDEDLFALVGAASALTGKPAGELVHAFGRFVFKDLVRLHPMFVKPGMRAKEFLKSVDRVIHVEVRKLHPGALLPAFSYEDPAPNRLVMIYRSPRKLCELAAGLLEGVSEHFGQPILYQHTQCLHRGADACRFELEFAPAAA